MATKMIDLQPYLKAMPVYTFLVNDHYVVIDGQKNSTGFDIALLFSDEMRAMAYARHYPSLSTARIVPTTIFNLIEHFKGRVEYFILDRPAIEAK